MRLLLLASLLLYPALLTGCASTTAGTVTARPMCRAIQLVRVSKDDVLTEGTASQVEANNLARKRLCAK
jgi:hypothetical protein